MFGPDPKPWLHCRHEFTAPWKAGETKPTKWPAGGTLALSFPLCCQPPLPKFPPPPPCPFRSCHFTFSAPGCQAGCGVPATEPQPPRTSQLGSLSNDRSLGVGSCKRRHFEAVGSIPSREGLPGAGQRWMLFQLETVDATPSLCLSPSLQ